MDVKELVENILSESSDIDNSMMKMLNGLADAIKPHSSLKRAFVKACRKIVMNGGESVE